MKYPSQERVAILENADDIALVKAIASGSRAEAVAKLVCSSQRYKSAVTSVILQKVCDSAQALASSQASHLVQRTPESLLTFSFTHLVSQWQSLQPLFVDVLKHVLAKRHRTTGVACIGVLGAYCLFQRNPSQSLLHHIIGLMLDQGGATNEVCILFISYVYLLAH